MAQIQSSCFYKENEMPIDLKLIKLKQNKMGLYEFETKAKILNYSGN